MTRERRAATVDDLFRLRWLRGADLAPDGRSAVYAVSRIESGDEETREYISLYRVSLADGQTQRLTDGRSRDISPVHSPDGRTLAFVSDRGGLPQIHLLSLSEGRCRPLTRMPQGANGPVWSPDGQWIAFTAGPGPTDGKCPDRTRDPYRITRSIWRFNAMGDLDLTATHVFLVSVASGEVRQLTHGHASHSDPHWSPDGTRLLFSSAFDPDRFDAMLPSLHIVDLAGNVADVLVGWTHKLAAWLPDGRSILFLGERRGLHPRGTHEDLYVHHLDSGRTENRTPGLELSIHGFLEGRSATGLELRGSLHPAREGTAAYVRVQRGGTVQICRVALTGKVSVDAVVDGDRSCTLLAIDDQHLLFSADDIARPHDLYLAKLDGSQERQLTHLNDELMAELACSTPLALEHRSSDGARVEGWYLPPSGHQRGPQPTVLWVHGGPHIAQGHTFAFDTLLLNGAGYGVMFFNQRGSTGYGNAFSTALFADWGNLDYQDLMSGVDAAVSAGLADPDRLGVCGISGGGFLSCWIVVHTRRFKAAVPQNPITNWSSFYGVSDVGVWFCVTQLGGHPHEIPHVYRKCSPITYAHACTTPTLLIQCEQDWRCPAEQSEQFYTVLRANGCPAEMQRLPGASHLGSLDGPPAVRRAHLSSQLSWFDRYLSGKQKPGGL